MRFTILQFGGIDIVINTAAIYPVPGADGQLTAAQWSKTFQINVTGNYLLAERNGVGLQRPEAAGGDGADQFGECSGSEERNGGVRHQQDGVESLDSRTGDRSGPRVRVNGIAPATVVAGSTMFPRDRVIHSLEKYKIEFSGIGIDRGIAIQTRGVLRAADADAQADSSTGLRSRDCLAGER